MNTSLKRFIIISVFVILLLPTIAIFFGGESTQFFEEAVRQNLIWGMSVYVFLEVASVVVIPITTIVLIPLAVEFFGPFYTSLLNILGWWIGSGLAFLIARHFGKSLVLRFVSKENVERYGRRVTPNMEFWFVVMIRMVTPVDVISYVLGLISQMTFSRYMLATLIGITPFAFIFSYASNAALARRFSVFAYLAIFAIVLFYIFSKSIRHYYK